MTNINRTDDYRSILALAAKMTDRLPLERRIALATLDYCDDPNMTRRDIAMLAADTFDYFNSL